VSGSRGFSDYFSGHSALYARYRPDYPGELFEFLAGLCSERRRAWDCATGSGQAAVALAEFFEEVVATDASEEQVRAASEHPRVVYRVAPAEQSGLEAGSVDLLTVAQALHWFERKRFWGEARRVLVAGGILAVWAYDLLVVSGPVDRAVRRLYHDVVGPYWPPERAVVERGYGTLEFPFAEENARPFRIRKRWTLADLLGYLETWSATQGYHQATGRDPIEEVRAELADAWGDPTAAREVHWDLDLRVGRK
jgi:SAM-dependent methyltransferase